VASADAAPSTAVSADRGALATFVRSGISKVQEKVDEVRRRRDFSSTRRRRADSKHGGGEGFFSSTC
jgi:hypothetical protein